jgi:hypothetical protein
MENKESNLRANAIAWWRKQKVSIQLSHWRAYQKIVFTPSHSPDELTGKEVEEIYVKEHLYCVSSDSLVYGKSCEKWCGDENCLRVKESSSDSGSDDILSEVEVTSSDMFGGVSKFTFKLSDANAIVLDYGEPEPMGVEGAPSWAKKEHYVENLWRDTQNDKSKGFGLYLILSILLNAKKSNADIVTGKMPAHTSDKLRNFYKGLGFKDIGSDEPDGIYIDVRTHAPIEHIKLLTDKHE